ncbi:protein PRRC2C-like isoform X5 [Panicum virgatum]|uniref:protein PRRC2C-like isoform X5 n=1 Tax=Panicum virgatum TaxID=38727 RepID=UPI0019D55E80|nr:protein PRRC2C-like isoform X5 [Panicum virgatum]
MTAAPALRLGARSASTPPATGDPLPPTPARVPKSRRRLLPPRIGAPLLSSRLLPPSTLAERKAVPLASPRETPQPDASETAAPPSSSTARLASAASRSASNRQGPLQRHPRDQDAAMQGGKWLWTKRRMADHPILSLTTGSIRPQVMDDLTLTSR